MSLRKPMDKNRRKQGRQPGRIATDSDWIKVPGESDLPEYEPEARHGEEAPPEDEETYEPDEVIPMMEMKEDPEEIVSEEAPQRKETPPRRPEPPREEKRVREERFAQRDELKERRRPAHGMQKSAEKKKETLVLTGIILDATSSFISVFPAVYYVLEEFLKDMSARQKEYRGIDFRYGLTLLHNEAESVSFSDGSFFTKDVDRLRKAIHNIEFYGGSLDGREDLDGALREQLRRQNECDPKEYERIYRGVILFSDSVSATSEPQDFSGAYLDEAQTIENNGVRFAQFYTFDGDYLPAMRMVDRDGRPTDNDKNIAVSVDIKKLIEGGEDAVTDEVRMMISTILNQTSVGMQ